MSNDEDELLRWVLGPADFLAKRDEVAVVASDAVPVYLDPGTVKILAPLSALDSGTARRRERHRQLEDTEEPEADALEWRPHSDAAGSNRKSKSRLTWICRQGLRGLFAQHKSPDSLPRGRDPAVHPLGPCQKSTAGWS